MLKQKERDRRARQSERRRGLRRAVLQLPRAAARERARASWHAKNAILALGFVVETLADEQASDAAVEAAIDAANGAYRAACLHGESIERHSAMELVGAIRGVASEVLEGLVELESVSCPVLVGALCPSTDADAFRAAVAAWVASERTMLQRGRAKRRPEDRWGPTFECVKRFGVANGIRSKENLRRAWLDARPNALPLTG